MAIEINVSRDFGRLLVVQGAPANWEDIFESFDEVLGYCEAIERPFEESKGDFWVLGTTTGGTTVFIEYEYANGYYYEHWLLVSGKHIEMAGFICAE